MEFFNQDCEGFILNLSKGEYKVIGKLKKEAVTSNKLMYLAPNPPNHLTNYSGSGLPYPNTKVAFENTPNKGVVFIKSDGSFEFNIHYPNSYYKSLGSNLIQPHVFIKLCNSKKIHSIKLDISIPNRYLDSNYKYKFGKINKPENLEIMTQEKLIRKKGI